MVEEVRFNNHDKKEYPPMHTAEHIINQAMCRLFGTGRSTKAHIEKKKSRLDFHSNKQMGSAEVEALEKEVNAVIVQDLPVTYLLSTRSEAEQYGVDISRIPADSSDAVRIVKVGNYDTCLCIGCHVEHTLQIGILEIYSHDYSPETETFRVRFRLRGADPVYDE